MTNETTEDAPVDEPFNQQEVKDFKHYYGQAVNGVLASVPFGVTVDPNQLAVIGRNIATSMVYAQREYLPEQLHEDEKSNFPQVGERLLNRDDVTSALKAVISQIGKATAARILTSFDVATVNGLRDDELYPCFQACMQALNDPANT